MTAISIKELKAQYSLRTTENASKAAKLRQLYNRFSIIRLIVFFVGIGLALWISDFGLFPVVTFIIIFIVGFGRFMAWHQGVAQKRKQHNLLSKINANEAKYLDLDIRDFENGEAFGHPAHSYAIDLDIFGQFSLFQYINRASTNIGKERLAAFFTKISTYDEMIARQNALVELSPKLDWRQHFQALSDQTEDSKSEIDALLHWLQNEDYVAFGKKWLNITLILFPIINISAIVAMFMGALPYQIVIVLCIGQLLLIRQFLVKINRIHQQTAQAEKFLKKYAKIIAHIEKETFETPKLKELHSLLFIEKTSASKALRRLFYIISQLNVRFNIFAIVLSSTLLWDLQWIKRLEEWKHQLKDELPNWFEALKEFEAINSLATLHYNHPDWNFPNIEPNAEKFNGIGLGHPLIHRDKRVTNDLALAKKGNIKLITGSNMAGKSTFLRTVGLNIVLAMMGAPVCAKRFELPILEVYTSMRTQDALEESTSSFYAELKRLKVIIEAVESQSNVFFLLDEILKGTNSNDRHKGAKALVLQLIKTQGMGLVATHDLELGVLENQYASSIENLCMEVEVLEQELIFDYTLKKGVSKSFNASFLMKNMGIKMD